MPWRNHFNGATPLSCAVVRALGRANRDLTYARGRRKGIGDLGGARVDGEVAALRGAGPENHVARERGFNPNGTARRGEGLALGF